MTLTKLYIFQQCKNVNTHLSHTFSIIKCNISNGKWVMLREIGDDTGLLITVNEPRNNKKTCHKITEIEKNIFELRICKSWHDCIYNLGDMQGICNSPERTYLVITGLKGVCGVCGVCWSDCYDLIHISMPLKSLSRLVIYSYGFGKQPSCRKFINSKE